MMSARQSLWLQMEWYPVLYKTSEWASAMAGAIEIFNESFGGSPSWLLLERILLASATNTSQMSAFHVMRASKSWAIFTYPSIPRGPSLTTVTIDNDGNKQPHFDASEGGVVTTNYPVQVLGLITGEINSYAKTFTIPASRSTVTTSRCHVDNQTSSVMCCAGQVRSIRIKIYHHLPCLYLCHGCHELFSKSFVVINTREASTFNSGNLRLCISLWVLSLRSTKFVHHTMRNRIRRQFMYFNVLYDDFTVHVTINFLCPLDYIV